MEDWEGKGMKRSHRAIYFAGVWILSFGVAFAPLAQASDAWSKLGRGISNIVFSWSEVFAQPAKMAEEGERWPIAAIGGGLKGVFVAVERVMVGAYEALTFPIPNPSGTFEPIMEPEFPIAKA